MLCTDFFVQNKGGKIPLLTSRFAFCFAKQGGIMDILKASDLKKIYGTGETAVHALDGVSLTVEKGEFVAIVGTS